MSQEKSITASEGTVAEKIVSVLTQDEVKTYREIVNAVAATENTVARELSDLVKLDQIERVKKGHYRLPTRKEPDRESLPGADTFAIRVVGPAGAGSLVLALDEETILTVELTYGEFVHHFKRPPVGDYWRRYALFEVSGDSAAPVYFDQEMVPVEILPSNGQRFRNHEVYVFRWQGYRMLKRLRRLDDGRVRLRSLNPSIDDQHITPNGEDFQIQAQVVSNEKQQLYTSLVGRFLRLD